MSMMIQSGRFGATAPTVTPQQYNIPGAADIELDKSHGQYMAPEVGLVDDE